VRAETTRIIDVDQGYLEVFPRRDASPAQMAQHRKVPRHAELELGNLP
jgi:hypothetical protein